MNHEEWKILISAYYDGETTTEEKTVVEAHLKECGECRKFYDSLRRISSTLKNWPEESLSPDITQKVHQKMVGQSKEGTKMYNLSKMSVSIATVLIVGLVAFSITQVQIKRGVQGRLKNATDDISMQQSLGKTQQYEPYYLSSSYDAEKSNEALGLSTVTRSSQMLASDALGPQSPESLKQIGANESVVSSNVSMQEQGAVTRRGNVTRTRASGGFQTQVYNTAFGHVAGIGDSNYARKAYNKPQVQQEYWGGEKRQYPVEADQAWVCSGTECGYRPNPVIYYPQPQPSGTEQYDYIQENQFLDATHTPLSTLSIDVDTASYSNVRRFLNQNQLPPADAVRIEEMVNYFTYDYPQPSWGKPFSITTEVSACPWNTQHELVLLGIQGKTLQTNQIPPSNLVFLIDVSGSMASANKLPLVKEGFKMLTQNLRPQDRVSIVVYAGAAGVVLNPTSGGDKYTILAALDRLQAGGSTAGGQGIELAYQIAQMNFIRNGNNRVILATDGDFNVGVSNDNDLVRLIEEKRQRGIYLSVLGFGMGNYKDSKMEKLADKGNGNYAYIDNINEAKKVMVTELGSMLFTIAKDVKIQIEFNPKEVKAYRLIGYENRILAKEDFNDDTKDAGELGAGHTVTALYEVIPARGFNFEPQKGSVDPLKYQTTAVKKSSDLMTVKLRYKEPNSNHSQLITKEVNRRWMAWGPTSSNFQFASAVAEFGLLLRNSQYKGNASYQNVLNRAQSAGHDSYGYRQEFIGLVHKAQSLDHRHSTIYPPPTPMYPSYPMPEESDPIQFKGQ